MLFQSEKGLQKYAERFLTWRNALKALGALVLMRGMYYMVAMYYLKKDISMPEFIADTASEFAAPGLLELQGIVGSILPKIYALNGIWFVLALVSFHFILQFSLNPMLRKVILNKFFNKNKNEKKDGEQNTKNEKQIKK